MAIYTRTGDDGQTSLAGGIRVDKDDLRIECMGEMDEANAWIGYLRSHMESEHPWQKPLRDLQCDLMKFMGFIARPDTGEALPDGAGIRHTEEFFEKWMDSMEGEMGASRYFLLPGGTEAASLCHLIRTKLRTVERRLVSLRKASVIPSFILSYINRLSDLFFVMARYDMHLSGSDEEKWKLFRASDEK